MSVRELPAGEAVMIVITRLFYRSKLEAKTCAGGAIQKVLAAKALETT